MPYYKALQKTSLNPLGNKLAKKYGLQKGFMVHKTKQHLLIVTDNIVAYIIYEKYVIPCIEYAKINNLVTIKAHLDDGALKPILGGADVMAQGVFKYIDKCDNFVKGDVVFIEINDDIVGVGIAMVGKDEITKDSKGVVIEIWQRNGDWSAKFL